jgi:hypothetical protein
LKHAYRILAGWHNIAWRSKLSEAILQNFPIFGQHQKQNNSARLPSKMES